MFLQTMLFGFPTQPRASGIEPITPLYTHAISPLEVAFGTFSSNEKVPRGLHAYTGHPVTACDFAWGTEAAINRSPKIAQQQQSSMAGNWCILNILSILSRLFVGLHNFYLLLIFINDRYYRRSQSLRL